MNVLTAEDFDMIENVALPMTELLPPPYDNPYMTALMRCSMVAIPLKTVALVLLDLRMEKYYAFPALAIS